MSSPAPGQPRAQVLVSVQRPIRFSATTSPRVPSQVPATPFESFQVPDHAEPSAEIAPTEVAV